MSSITTDCKPQNILSMFFSQIIKVPHAEGTSSAEHLSVFVSKRLVKKYLIRLLDVFKNSVKKKITVNCIYVIFYIDVNIPVHYISVLSLVADGNKELDCSGNVA